MKHKILLLSFSCLLFSCLYAQQNSGFAITSKSGTGIDWKDIRSIDLSSGTTNSFLFENGKTHFSFLNADHDEPVKKIILPVPLNLTVGRIANAEASITDPSPTSLASAATAYDARRQKLFFASMQTGALIWMDLSRNNAQPVFYTIDQPLLKNADINNQALNITRMTIGSNGDGYAITNDGNHLIRFTTGSKILITDLGSLVDAESNSGISVHNPCSSWGGDVVADATGGLVLFTAAQSVYAIDPDSRIATYRGNIKNLPPAFSVNGAAVDKDGQVIVSSANGAQGFYRINMGDLAAQKMPEAGGALNASDLASSFMLNQDKVSIGSPVLPAIDVIGNALITIYPNPVTEGQIKIAFEKKVAGEYKIELTDFDGRLIDYKRVFIKAPGQIEYFKLRFKPSAGLYLIKITDVQKKIIFSDKLMVE